MARKTGSKKGFSVKNKLITAFTLILIIPCLAVGVFGFVQSKSTVDEQLMWSAQENVHLLNEIINNLIDPNRKNVEFLAASITRERLAQENGKLVLAHLNQFQGLHDELATTYIGTDAGQMLLAPEQPLPEGFDPRKRPWYELAMSKKGEVVITEPYVSEGDGNSVTVTIARTVSDHSAVLAVDLKLDSLANVVKTVKIGKEGYVGILDAGNRFIVHPTAKPGSKGEGWYIEEMYKSDKGMFEYEFDGALKKMVFDTNKLTGWKLSGTMYANETDSAAAPILYNMVFVIVVAILIGSVVNYLLIRSILRPLHLIREATLQVAAGDLTVALNTNKNDEIGELAQTFDTMRESLRSVLQEVAQTAEHLASSSEELTASAEQSAQATEHIAENAQELAVGSEHQTRSVEESSRVIQDMSIGAQQIAGNAQGVSHTARQAADLAEEGNGAITKAMTQMHAISETVGGLSQAVKGLGERSNEIGQIVEVITQISEQTNLLALNAAIEAARAGAHGRGFAVVADEVRKLAEQSSQSAQQIGHLIVSIQSETQQAMQSMQVGQQEVETGLQVVNVAGSSFEAIQRSVAEVSKQIEEVTTACEVLSAGTNQVVQSIETIAEVANTSAAGTQNVSASAEEQLASMQEITASAAALSKVADELQQVIRKFKM